jgi:excisionase family DNA binding protein
MLITVREVAERLAVSRRHVWRIISQGELPAIKFGKSTRVRVMDLEQFIERHRS